MAARPECGLDRRSQAFDPAAACRWQLRSHAVIADRLDDGTIDGRFGNGEEIREIEAAPRRPQHRKPGEAIGRLRQRARQRQQVARRQPVVQRLQIDRGELDAGRSQYG